MLHNLLYSQHRPYWINFSRYIAGQFFQYEAASFAILYKHYDWEVYMDTYALSSIFTRICMPFMSKVDFTFHIYEGESLGYVEQFRGKTDHIIGDKHFDSKYIISSNSPTLVSTLFAQSDIKYLIKQIPQIDITIQQYAHTFYFEDDSNPPQMNYADQLYFEKPKIISDPKQLFYLFKLFTLILDQLVKIDVAYAKAPAFSILEQDTNQ